ncbi:BolA family transcriptional regulator [Leeia sp. TBRC 13508]|uniref:BolA family transcriptional regulator n=1 Tax=Leeia speluncae TaxID=2884804 RepID=A0ABS8D2K5_9NEIS|nr:BolA family protein [Leeia speluncae]MCB6182216.1 BolA family transcriptional regulator [Leeia speluncae]
MSDQVETLFKDRLAVLSPESFTLTDDSGSHIGHAGSNGGGHYFLTVVSAAFEGKSRLARHRMVLDCFKDLIPATIHALSITAYTPTEL